MKAVPLFAAIAKLPGALKLIRVRHLHRLNLQALKAHSRFRADSARLLYALLRSILRNKRANLLANWYLARSLLRRFLNGEQLTMRWTLAAQCFVAALFRLEAAAVEGRSFVSPHCLLSLIHI